VVKRCLDLVSLAVRDRQTPETYTPDLGIGLGSWPLLDGDGVRKQETLHPTPQAAVLY
jgi:hypothetical protein